VLSEANPFAGQGPVLLDIGGHVGALVVVMPAALDGVEVEIRAVGPPAAGGDHGPDHVHGGDHGHDDGAHRHHHEPAAGQTGVHHPHVAVLARPVDSTAVHSLVFPELVEGDYELYQRPAGPVELAVRIRGGEVTEAVWPTGLPASRT
jgi:hypothetical protein